MLLRCRECPAPPYGWGPRSGPRRRPWLPPAPGEAPHRVAGLLRQAAALRAAPRCGSADWPVGATDFEARSTRPWAACLPAARPARIQQSARPLTSLCPDLGVGLGG